MVVTSFLTLLGVFCIHCTLANEPHFGERVGDLSRLQHGLKGSVYIVDSMRLRIRDFYYDGKGPAAYFWVGVNGSATPNYKGLKIPNEKGSTEPLKKYTNADVLLTLPSTISVDDLSWLSVWCQKFSVDFGNVKFPSTVNVPQTAALGQLLNPTHGLSSGVVTITSVRTINVNNFKFDGLEKDVYFVAGNNSDSSDRYAKLWNHDDRAVSLGQSNDGIDVELMLPLTYQSSSTILNFQFIGVHSFTSDSTLARVDIPPKLNVPPYIANIASNSTGSEQSATAGGVSNSSPN